MPNPRDAHRIGIAGASALLGAELKSRLDESRFARWDVSVVDEEIAAGTLTEAGGEPAVIQPVEEDTFDRAKLIFFTGSAAFAERNLSAARESGAIGHRPIRRRIELPGVQVWFGKDGVGSRLPTTRRPFTQFRRLRVSPPRNFSAPSGQPGLFAPLAIVFFRPVSEAGRPGIEELESQTTQLLSFQSAGQPVFDTQVAFNLIDRYGPTSRESLQSVRARIRNEAGIAVGRNSVQPSIQVLHAPVFYGYTFAATAELNSKSSKDALVESCRKAGFTLESDPNSPLGNLNASGDSAIHLALPESDPAQSGTWWFWGAADNVRVPTNIAIKLAEKLVA